MVNSSIKELNSISKELKDISHKVRTLPSNRQEGMDLSVQLYEICKKLENIANSLDDDCK